MKRGKLTVIIPNEHEGAIRNRILETVIKPGRSNQGRMATRINWAKGSG